MGIKEINAKILLYYDDEKNKHFAKAFVSDNSLKGWKEILLVEK